VRLFNPENGLLEPVACRNLDEKEWKTEAWRGGRGLANVAFETNAPTIIRNAQSDPRVRDPEFYRKHKLISYLGIPLIAKEKTLGVIGFYTKQKHDFSNDEVEFLKTLAGQAGIAIYHAQLFEEIGRSKKELESTNQYLDKSLRQLGGLYTALTPIDSAASMPELMGGIIERLMGATGADAALIRVWNKEDGTFPIIGHRGFSDDYLKRVETAPPGGALEWVIKHSESIIAPDIASEPRLKGKVQLQLGLRSCAILPLNVHGEVRGILHVASCKLGYFNEEQKDQLTAIARQMSIALDNHELFYSLKSSRDELEKANQVKDEFLGIVSHELRTPLNVIMGYTGLLQEGMFGELSPEQNNALHTVTIQSQDLLSIVSKILQATRIESGEIIPVIRTAVNLTGFLDELKMAYDIPTKKELTIDWDYPFDLPYVETDSGKLKEILQNLLSNALKFTEEGSVSISAQYIPEAKTLVLRVADTGVGIPKELVPIIFEKFRQVDGSNTRLHGGVGLGLYIVKKYTELLGGEVEVKSELGKGSTFTVTIPCETARYTTWQDDRFEQAL
jgi:signal transduction histidine kinase